MSQTTNIEGLQAILETVNNLPTTIPADNVTAGIFNGQVQANEEATAELAVAQVRNVVILNADPGEGATVNYPDGTVVHVYESTV